MHADTPDKPYATGKQYKQQRLKEGPAHDMRWMCSLIRCRLLPFSHLIVTILFFSHPIWCE